MAHNVYLVGLWDDSMTYWLLDKAEWDRIDRREMQDQDFTPFISWDLLEYKMTPEEFEEFKAENGEILEGSIEDDFTLDQILDLVKRGVINIIKSAEGLQL